MERLSSLIFPTCLCLISFPPLYCGFFQARFTVSEEVCPFETDVLTTVDVQSLYSFVISPFFAVLHGVVREQIQFSGTENQARSPRTARK